VKRCLSCDERFDTVEWRCPRCGYAPEMRSGFPAFAGELAGAAIAYDASRFAALARVEDRHFWFTARNTLIAWALRNYFPRARSFLEVGCGTGNVLGALSAALPGLALEGGEAHASALALARPRAPAARLSQMDARNIPYVEEFDVVAAFDVIEHVEDDAAVLAQMFAACRRGGGILLTVPQHAWLWSHRDEFAGHRRRYARSTLLARLAAAGFVRPWTTSFMSLLLPLMVLARLAQRNAQGFDPDRELALTRSANRLLGAAMTIERFAIRCGVSFPAGGSLLAVAHKP
jgi:SAM-dependent methyltransferase